MQAIPVTMIPAPSSQPAAPTRSRGRTVLIASSDSSLRERLRHSLSGLRWQVLEAPGCAEAWLASQASHLEAMLIDPWLPDMNVNEFLEEFRREHPHVDLVMTDGIAPPGSPRSPYHQELLYALRRSQDGDTAAWNVAPVMATPGSEPSRLVRPTQFGPGRLPVPASSAGGREALEGVTTTDSQTLPAAARWEFEKDFEPEYLSSSEESPSLTSGSDPNSSGPGGSGTGSFPSAFASSSVEIPVGGRTTAAGDGRANGSASHRRDPSAIERIPELIGSSPCMLEVSRRIRLVAARSTPVLIEGPTGSGKELVAEALHRLSGRSRKPFVAINCAAIPEALLEAELFGHTRGAFTGAVQGRTGRIESADGGTLFLDEIGEMPLGLQSKLLRFFESGELQRIGDNETVKVDVRIVAATHQPLAEDAQKGLFRADLYYRLAVFLIRTPALAEHMEDLPQLVAHFMERMGRKSPVKRVDLSSMNTLAMHAWPGNVRELEHVLERGGILAGDEPVITAAEIDFGFSAMN